MHKWIIAVESNCADKAKVKEFNRWYDETHLPDMLEIPGLVNATRFENVEPAEGASAYLAVYELATDDLSGTLAEAGKLLEKKAKLGRISPLLQMTKQTVYRQVAFVKKQGT